MLTAPFAGAGSSLQPFANDNAASGEQVARGAHADVVETIRVKLAHNSDPSPGRRLALT
jgi:hypothetical protein